VSEREAKRALTKHKGSGSLQTYGGHLKQLRRALLISIAAIFVAFFVILNFFTSPLITFLLRPIVARGVIVVATGVKANA